MRTAAATATATTTTAATATATAGRYSSGASKRPGLGDGLLGGRLRSPLSVASGGGARAGSSEGKRKGGGAYFVFSLRFVNFCQGRFLGRSFRRTFRGA